MTHLPAAAVAPLLPCPFLAFSFFKQSLLVPRRPRSETGGAGAAPARAQDPPRRRCGAAGPGLPRPSALVLYSSGPAPRSGPRPPALGPTRRAWSPSGLGPAPSVPPLGPGPALLGPCRPRSSALGPALPSWLRPLAPGPAPPLAAPRSSP